VTVRSACPGGRGVVRELICPSCVRPVADAELRPRPRRGRRRPGRRRHRPPGPAILCELHRSGLTGAAAAGWDRVGSPLDQQSRPTSGCARCPWTQQCR
jgi:hypothetical protein